jgi:hypothetical protein
LGEDFFMKMEDMLVVDCVDERLLWQAWEINNCEVYLRQDTREAVRAGKEGEKL